MGTQLSQAVGILRLSLRLLQVLGPKGGRQQLLDCTDVIGTIRLGHVDVPVGAELERRQSQREGGRVAEGWDRPGFEPGSLSPAMTESNSHLLPFLTASHRSSRPGVACLPPSTPDTRPA